MNESDGPDGNRENVNRVDVAKTNALLQSALLRYMPEAGKYPTAVPGLLFARYDQPTYLKNSFYKPLLGVILAGSKLSRVGSEEYRYGVNQCLIVGVDVPSAYYITDAAPEKPYLGISIELDKPLLLQLVKELQPLEPGPDDCCKGVSVADVDPDVLDAFLRLTELLDHPAQISILAPMIVREIHYRMLTGPQGRFLRMSNTLGTPVGQIAQAVAWMRGHYQEQLNVAQLAQQVNMATSTFHHHFKIVTTLSPLQFHKRLRLHEARRLMLEEQETAGSACLAVGYESQAQFTREYKQVFGVTPSSDVRKLREMSLSS